MSANVETMFSVREKPWHGLGEIIQTAPTSADAIHIAGLDWRVEKRPVFTQLNDSYISMQKVDGFFANVRSTDDKVLGIVSKDYKIVQNDEAFAFTDSLLGEGVTYETAGSLNNGKRIWLLAKIADTKVLGDMVEPYLVFTNSHDGRGAIRVCVTPIRVVCQNTLNLALDKASRSWSTIHVGDIQQKLEEANRTLTMATNYLTKFNEEAEYLEQLSFSDRVFKELIEELLPIEDGFGEIRANNVRRLREDLVYRYEKAPDLKKFRGTGWGVMNAVSDFATHVKPLRLNPNYKDAMFSKTIDGNPIIDKAYSIIKELAA